MKPKKKIKRVVVTFELLLLLVTEGNSVSAVDVVKGVPEDALFAGSYFDGKQFEAYLLFTHPDFDEVMEGAAIPILSVEHEKKI